MTCLIATPHVEQALAIHKKAWGDRHYERGVDQLLEEMSELAKAVLKERRSDECFRDQILDEIADVVLCMELVARWHGIQRADLARHVDEKSELLTSRLWRGTADPRIGPTDLEVKS